uniref:F-box/kelch-repeat protein n=1 Tax=Noccaea caerulescens TaxID=107243 RepID=A0A1J3EEW3_NOCCA
MSSKARSSAGTNVAKPPRRRKKKTMKPTPVPEPTSISSLPYDLLLSCITRIFRSYYPTLSLVSKNFRSIVASPELYQTRSRLGLTESCLYMCLRYPRVPDTYWFTLCRKPNRTITAIQVGNLFIPITSPNFTPAESTSIVAVGSEIYKIGGYMVSSSRVSVLDCRFHTWHQAPRMRVKRRSPTAGIVDGKIYVAGGCKDVNSSNWVEVFDPKTQTWGNVTNPGTETRSEA